MVTQSLAAGRRAHACGRRERALVVLAIGVIALHVVDDSFVQPQPGTSATDHLVSGLVPAGRAGARGHRVPAAARGVARACWRSLLGVFGLGTASEAWYYTREVGASGDDYTGLLAIPAGLMLLAVGVVTLWRSRRLDERMPRRYCAAALIGVGGSGRRRRGRVSAGLLLRVHAHRPRGRAARPNLGADFEERLLHDRRRAGAPGLVRALEEPRRRDRVPRAQGPAAAGQDAGAPRLRRAAVRPARRGRQRGRSERASAGTATGTSRPRSRSCASGPTWTPSASAGWGSRSAAS